MSRHCDTASINFNITLPPKIIREYFDGLAKVEEAKHSTNQSSDFDLSSLLSLAPLILSVIGGLSSGAAKTPASTFEHSKSGLKCKSFPETKCVFECKPCPESDNEKTSFEIGPELVVSFGSPVEKQSGTDCEVPEGSDEPKLKEKCEDEQEKKVQPKNKAVYQDLTNVVVDLKNLTGGAGSPDLTEMMKMFGPVMEGLLGGINQINVQKPDTTNTQDNVKISSENSEAYLD